MMNYTELSNRFKYKIYLTYLVNFERLIAMKTEIIDMGKVSSRGQIAIPSDIRSQMGLREGEKVLFMLQDDTLLMKRVTAQTFESITRPLKEAKKKIKEEDVSELVHQLRK